MEELKRLATIQEKDLEIGEFIDSGTTSAVFRGKWNNNGEILEVAIKRIRVFAGDELAISREISVMQNFSSSDNICKLYGCCLVESGPLEVRLVMELADRALGAFVKKFRPLSKDLQLSLCVQATMAVATLHNAPSPILHRDIKAFNFLVRPNGKLIITDFGHAQTKAVVDDYTFTDASIRWTAPEIIKHKRSWSEKADIFSLGMVFYEIITGEVPYNEPQHANMYLLFNVKKKGTLPKLPDDCLPDLAVIIKKCWASKPEKRPDINQLLDLLGKVTPVDDKDESMEESMKESIEESIDLARSESEEEIDEDEAHSVAKKQEELQSLLLAAPESIKLFAHLCLIYTTTEDFRLQIPLKGFKHIRSERFCGAIIQVVKHGTQVFALASKNVAIIETYSRIMPEIVSEVLQLLRRISADVEAIAPKKLTTIAEMADQCSQLASETEQMVESLVEVINELTESFTASSSECEARYAKQSSETSMEGIATVKLTKASHDQIRLALLDGSQKLTQFRGQWNKLARFFNKLAQIIKIEMQESLNIFNRTVTQTVSSSKMQRKKEKLTLYVEDTLHERVQEIAQKGLQANMITTMYLDIGQKYLHIPLQRLDEFITLNSTDLSLVDRLQLDITATCAQAQQEIADKVEGIYEETIVKFRAEMDAVGRKAKLIPMKKKRSRLYIFTRK